MRLLEQTGQQEASRRMGDHTPGSTVSQGARDRGSGLGDFGDSKDVLAVPTILKNRRRTFF
jgi:hypothetical protein